jgi:hypothetical protein
LDAARRAWLRVAGVTDNDWKMAAHMTAEQTSGANGCKPDAQALCPQCGAQFNCGMRNLGQTCWCATLPHTEPVPTAGDPACLCPDCLRARLLCEGRLIA